MLFMLVTARQHGAPMVALSKPLSPVLLALLVMSSAEQQPAFTIGTWAPPEPLSRRLQDASAPPAAPPFLCACEVVSVSVSGDALDYQANRDGLYVRHVDMTAEDGVGCPPTRTPSAYQV